MYVHLCTTHFVCIYISVLLLIGLLWDMTGQYVHTFVFAGLSIVASAVFSIAIVFVRQKSRSRAVSESADIVPGPEAKTLPV